MSTALPPRARRRRWPWIVFSSVLFAVLLVAPHIWAVVHMERPGPPEGSLICDSRDGYDVREALRLLPEGDALPITDLTDFTWDTAWFFSSYTSLDEMSEQMGGVDLGPDFHDRRWCAWTGMYFVDDGELVHVWSFDESLEFTRFGLETQWYPDLTFRRTDGQLQYCYGEVCE
jgi:hypothetical protein